MTLAKKYFCWHYTLAFIDIFSIWRNIAVFVYNFFSIPVLARTFFAPWKRIHADRKTQGLNLADLAATFCINFIMRVLGAIMRTTIIIAGITTLSIVIIVGLTFFLLWALVPLVAILFWMAGMYLIIFK